MMDERTRVLVLLRESMRDAGIADEAIGDDQLWAFYEAMYPLADVTSAADAGEVRTVRAERPWPLHR